MNGITFNNLPPIQPMEPGRMDVACFVGFAPLAHTPLFSDTLTRWLVDYGWNQVDIDKLANEPALIRNTPIPLESWDAFCAVFDDTRLDRIDRLTGKPLENILTIEENDKVFYVIVDGKNVSVKLTPAPNGQLFLVEIVDQIREELAHIVATVSIDSRTESRLVIERNDKVKKGELTVYKNDSLGFLSSFQADSVYLQNYTAAAIKAFFQQGGQKCYFICMGDPLPYEADGRKKCEQLYQLIWGKEKKDGYFNDLKSFEYDDFLRIFFPDIPGPTSSIRDWAGLSHLAGLSDVTYVCFPDLIDVLGKPAEDEPQKPTRADKEVFVICSESISQDEPWSFTTLKHAPLYDEKAYTIWKRVIKHILSYLSNYARTVQLVAALALPDKRIQKDFDRFVLEKLFPLTENDENSFRQLQLVFPWLKTKWSGMLPGMLQPPEGSFLGLLASHALRVGAFRSIAGSFLDGVYDLWPVNMDAYNPSDLNGLSFADRVCWVDFVPDGIALQSDVTADLEGNCRYGAVRRIMIIVQRTAQRIGLDYVFEPSSERVWQTVRNSLNNILYKIYINNGLRGKNSQEAYFVECGRSTMTQNDIDNGRLIANVSFQPAVPIERIAVDILLERNGKVIFGY